MKLITFVHVCTARKVQSWLEHADWMNAFAICLLAFFSDNFMQQFAAARVLNGFEEFGWKSGLHLLKQ